MAHQPDWARPAAAQSRTKSGASCVACFIFVAAMGAAFWMGTIWASQAWAPFSR
jgi:hypothetical protein